MNPIIKKFQYGNQTVTLETGRIARQATGAVLVTMGEVSVLCTVVGSKDAKAGQDFFPLSVHCRLYPAPYEATIFSTYSNVILKMPLAAPAFLNR